MSDITSARELELFIENDGQLYSSMKQNIDKNMSKKHKNGSYEFEKAIKAYMHLVDSGAKKYAKEFGSTDDKWFEMFPKDVRELVAKSIAKGESAELELGNYTE